MELKLVDRNANTISDAYGLTEAKYVEIIKNAMDSLQEKLQKSINNEFVRLDKDEILAAIVFADDLSVNIAANIISILENCKIEKAIDVIEIISMLNPRRQHAYITLIRSYETYINIKNINGLESDDLVNDLANLLAN